MRSDEATTGHTKGAAMTCDACPATATHTWTHDGFELVWCDHHHAQYRERLAATGWVETSQVPA